LQIEIWRFVAKKARNVRKDDSPEIGDQWVFVAMDAENKIVPTYFVGRRTQDLHKRTASHGHSALVGVIPMSRETRLGWTRTSGNSSNCMEIMGSMELNGTPQAQSSRLYPRSGCPDPKHISTSFIERQNLTMRMQMRRFTRLTNAFSKKLGHLKAAPALYFAYYNFCRVHATLRVTPAMEAGLTDHV
jgi:IS1 family transposase